ncbi:glycine receptor subunit alphaZ1-like isoform X1 [Folsomia candida]|uniref:glycine receptor subunit alphaZ1-like isoform X1 n=1 Tax=Folsomia candida TaxID=158441 RepID=UPI0016054077|nr:glycine receptor subunit alphaZ1-like isoform X1 [Folsomia candida]
MSSKFLNFSILCFSTVPFVISNHIENLVGGNRVRRDTDFNQNNNRLIPDEYDVNEPPPTLDGSVVYVNVSVLVLDIRDIDEMHEYISMEYKLKLFWQDLRLQNLTKPEEGFTVLSLTVLKEIWKPDIYIEHVKSIESPEILTKPASLRLYPDGRLRYSARYLTLLNYAEGKLITKKTICRMTVTVACPMNFKYYPADTQLCDIDMQTYGYQTHQLRLEWDKTNGYEYAARLSDMVYVSNFELDMLGDNKFALHSTSGPQGQVSQYSGLRFTIVLRRNISYHLLQTYLPSIIYMLVSWLSFILPLESASERMGYCVTCLFTLTSTFSAVRQSTPIVSYGKILDIWMIMCIFFVFLTLVQHAIISKVRRTKIRVKMSRANAKKRRNCGENETSFTTSDAVTKSNDNGKKTHTTIYQKIAKKANLYLSLIIPLLFLIFNIGYWSVIIYVKIMSV